MNKNKLNFHVAVNRNVGNGISPYRLVDISGNEIKEVNKYLDSLAIRGLSERTMRIYAYDLLNFWIWLTQAKIKLKDITKAFLLEYVQYLRQHSSPAPVTINHRLVVADCLYQYHFDKHIPNSKRKVNSFNKRSINRIGWLHPVRLKRLSTRVKVPRKLVVPLNHQEVSEFFSSLKSWRDIAICGFMLFCGLRSREVINLKLDDISITENQVRIHGKGDKERIVPLPKELLKTLNRYLKLERPEKSSNNLFVILKGNHRGRPLTSPAIRKIFLYHRKISGIHKANAHRFRHSFGANMARAGISLVVLMKLMGHTHIQTTMQYVNLFAEDIRAEFNKAIDKLHTQELMNESKTGF